MVVAEEMRASEMAKAAAAGLGREPVAREGWSERLPRRYRRSGGSAGRLPEVSAGFQGLFNAWMGVARQLALFLAPASLLLLAPGLWQDMAHQSESIFLEMK